ncbi:hypothetical protein BK657_11020 [Pseudomonas brassicacearum]|nr:hypothetical protein BK657_11020 [Pseudomonas brassicacearum]
MLSDNSHSLGCMGEGMSDQLQIILIQLHGFGGCQRLIVQDVQRTLQASAELIAATTHQAKPARQPEHRQDASDGLTGG